ncbi:hypothetical protein SCLARK_00893 [Spiroplasma clarkii]|uniref:HTH rpiR-type domain-containing protein n=1 Tax=Spiroplasma clarkii TaxID=2139 RepID=A0A1Y0L0F6_9MOLU|nr:MurR/RpiR family transcriptional regulator [Spiroplasma clarkii]ARU91504.1 hypothetical protein SCLARK_00893 [Spiroplasma clarkii]ATX70919.1 hypothetical protein SCLAR_v1c06000 [Spiroplasma clarkii]
MKNIRETLVNLAKQENTKAKNLDSFIANAILKNYNSGIFLNQVQLAEQCFLSASAITKFSKKLGFTGYREFNFNLKNEYLKYYVKDKQEINSTSKIKNFFDVFVSEINEQLDFVNDFINMIKTEKRLLIVSSYQLQDSAKYCYEIFSELGIEVAFQTVRIISNKILSTKISEVPVLCFLAGQDNYFLVECLNRLDHQNLATKLWLICTESQANKVVNFHQRFIVSKSGYAPYKFRKIFIDYLILNIYCELVQYFTN